LIRVGNYDSNAKLVVICAQGLLGLFDLLIRVSNCNFDAKLNLMYSISSSWVIEVQVGWKNLQDRIHFLFNLLFLSCFLPNHLLKQSFGWGVESSLALVNFIYGKVYLVVIVNFM
jgi:hypothetical protein